MKVSVFGLGVALALATITGTAAQQTSAPQPPDQPLFRASVRTVSIYATVLDANGRLVPDLERDDFVALL